jgi:hypothetical protein
VVHIQTALSGSHLQASGSAGGYDLVNIRSITEINVFSGSQAPAWEPGYIKKYRGHLIDNVAIVEFMLKPKVASLDGLVNVPANYDLQPSR